MTSHDSKAIYVWEWPVRFFHWINAICITVLIGTGFLIGQPVAIQSGQEASFNYWYGYNRFFHFAAAYLFIFNLLVRVYWAFVGNEYASWRELLPLTPAKRKEIIDVLQVDILQMTKKRFESIGHNAVAGSMYFVIFLVSLVQMMTGFALMAPASDSWMARTFAWVPAMVGSDAAVRNLHHWCMWVYILFILTHVYLVFYHDYVEKRGVLSSIVGGWKHIEQEEK